MPCLELKPFPVCGVFGDCRPSGNNTFNCVCDQGWSQSREFAYFNPDNDILSGSCFYNQSIIDALYSLVLIFSVLSVVQAMVKLTRNQLQRQIPSIISRILMIILSIYRLSYPEVALVGEDVFFSFLVAMNLLFFHVQHTMFFNKYILYMLQKTEILDPEKNIRRVVFLNRLNYVHIPFQVVLTQLLWVSSLTDRKSAYALFYWFFLLSLIFSSLFMLLLAMDTLGSIISDLEKFLATKNNTGLDYEKVNINKQQEDDFTIWARQYLPRLKRLRKLIFLIRTGFGSIYLLSIVLEGFFQLWTYFIPLVMLMIIWAGIAVVNLLRQKIKSAKLSNTSLRSGSNVESLELTRPGKRLGT